MTDIIKNCNLEVQNSMLNVYDFNFFLYKSKEMTILNKIKNNKNIDINSPTQAIVESLMSDNKYILKKSKKDIIQYKNELNKIIKSVTFKNIIEIENF